jgi:hypothetical protein
MVRELRVFLLVVALGGLCGTVRSQDREDTESNVGNVRFESLGDQVSILYDLDGGQDDRFRVTVSLRRESDASFRHPLLKVSGDVGPAVFAGMYKRIVWDMKGEFPDGLPGEDYYFVVHADPVSSGSFPLLWVGAGVAVIGGVASYLLLQKDDAGSSSVQGPPGFPAPPGRP